MSCPKMTGMRSSRFWPHSGRARAKVARGGVASRGCAAELLKKSSFPRCHSRENGNLNPGSMMTARAISSSLCNGRAALCLLRGAKRRGNLSRGRGRHRGLLYPSLRGAERRGNLGRRIRPPQGTPSYPLSQQSLSPLQQKTHHASAFLASLRLKIRANTPVARSEATWQSNPW